MHLLDLVQTSRRVGETSGRRAKLELLSELLRRASPAELPIIIAFLSGAPRQQRTGAGYASLHAARPDTAADRATLGVAEVDAALDGLTRIAGKGSANERHRVLSQLFSRATADEQDFLFRLLIGELRQGALEGLMTEAVARAGGLPPGDVRRAAMLTGNLGAVAQVALTEGAAGLKRYNIELLRPLQPMLAQSADDIGEAIERLGEAGLEYKLDGARIQVHKAGEEVRVYSRLLNDVTAAVPEIVEVVRRLPMRDAILDGEAIALRDNGTPHPFQVTMSRFGRRLDVERLRPQLPLQSFFFDLLSVDGTSFLDEPYTRRVATLSEVLPGSLLVPRIVTSDVGVAESFLKQAMDAGHEGVMAKTLAAGYDAGARGSAWLKVKPAHTLDLVVLAAEWGHGRRHGWLSNLHLGARDPATGGFVMLGKTFKGMTDEMLAWQTEHLKALQVTQDGHVVFVRPELVVEVAFNNLQTSTQYPGGLALRFARIKRYRSDKRADQADTIETVRQIAATES